MTAPDYHALPPDLPVPVDDGAADHLPGTRLPDLALRSTLGGAAVLAEAAGTGTLVLYVYPRTGTPGEPSPDGWDAIPGARGCTPQSCAFRDHAGELAALRAQVLSRRRSRLRSPRASTCRSGCCRTRSCRSRRR
jgi:peroxiredoxin